MRFKKEGLISIGITFLCLFSFLSIEIKAQELERYQFRSNHMGSQFTIVLYSDSKQRAEALANDTFNLIEEMNRVMSDYLPESELNRLSATSGSDREVKVSDSLFEILKSSKEISENTVRS